VQYRPIQQLYGNIVGIYKRSVEREGRKFRGAEGENREGSKKGEKGSVRKPRKSKKGLYMVATNGDGKGAVIAK